MYHLKSPQKETSLFNMSHHSDPCLHTGQWLSFLIGCFSYILVLDFQVKSKFFKSRGNTFHKLLNFSPSFRYTHTHIYIHTTYVYHMYSHACIHLNLSLDNWPQYNLFGNCKLIPLILI